MKTRDWMKEERQIQKLWSKILEGGKGLVPWLSHDPCTEIEGPPIVKQALYTISHYDETKRAITDKDAQHRLSDEEVPSEG